MNWSPVPPLVAGIVAVAISVTRRLPALVVESSVSVPSPRALSMYVYGGRFVSFVLVYGVLFGLAYWARRRRDDANGTTNTVLAAGALGAVAYAVGAGVLLLFTDPQGGPLLNAVLTLGTGVAVGTQLAVVTFAGAALGDRR